MDYYCTITMTGEIRIFSTLDCEDIIHREGRLASKLGMYHQSIIASRIGVPLKPIMKPDAEIANIYNQRYSKSRSSCRNTYIFRAFCICYRQDELINDIYDHMCKTNRVH